MHWQPEGPGGGASGASSGGMTSTDSLFGSGVALLAALVAAVSVLVRGRQAVACDA